MKKRYKATLADGSTVTRMTERTYTHFYRTVFNNADGVLIIRAQGFSGSLALAEEAARVTTTRYACRYEIVPAVLQEKV